MDGSWLLTLMSQISLLYNNQPKKLTFKIQRAERDNRDTGERSRHLWLQAAQRLALVLRPSGLPFILSIPDQDADQC